MHSAKILFTSTLLAAVLAVTWSAPSRGTCPDPRDWTLTGDDGGVIQMTANFVPWVSAAYGINLDEFYNHDINDWNGDRRRMLNALWMVNAVKHNGVQGFWHEAASSRINDVGQDDDCVNDGVNISAYYDTYKDLFMARKTLLKDDIVRRASTVVHEARHHDEDHNGTCQRPCDSGWFYDGSYTWQVKFLADASHHQQLFPPFVLDENRGFANSILSKRFQAEPGFRLAGVHSWEQDWSWTLGDISAGYLPEGADNAPTPIVGIKLRKDAEYPSYVGVTTALVDGWLNSGTLSRKNGHVLPPVDERMEAVLPAGYVATGVLLKVRRTAATLDAPLLQHAVAVGIVGHRLGADGRPDPSLPVVTVFSDAAAPEGFDEMVEIHADPGHFLTGFGYGRGLLPPHQNSFGQWMEAYGDFVMAKRQLASHLVTPFIQTGNLGNFALQLGCPPGEIGVGTTQVTAPDTEAVSTTKIAVSGILCAPISQVRSQSSAPTSVVLNGFAYPDDTGYDESGSIMITYAAYTADYLPMVAGFTGHTSGTARCDDGYALRSVHAGASEDRLRYVSHIRCAPVWFETNPYGNTETIDLGDSAVGAANRVCPNESFATGLYVKRNAGVQGIALSCSEQDFNAPQLVDAPRSPQVSVEGTMSGGVYRPHYNTRGVAKIDLSLDTVNRCVPDWSAVQCEVQYDLVAEAGNPNPDFTRWFGPFANGATHHFSLEDLEAGEWLASVYSLHTLYGTEHVSTPAVRGAFKVLERAYVVKAKEVPVIPVELDARTCKYQANLAATSWDRNGDTVELEFEWKPTGTPFSEVPSAAELQVVSLGAYPANAPKSLRRSGSIDVTLLPGYGTSLVTSFHWRVRARDNDGLSQWANGGTVLLGESVLTTCKVEDAVERFWAAAEGWRENYHALKAQLESGQVFESDSLLERNGWGCGGGIVDCAGGRVLMISDLLWSSNDQTMLVEHNQLRDVVAAGLSKWGAMAIGEQLQSADVDPAKLASVKDLASHLNTRHLMFAEIVDGKEGEFDHARLVLIDLQSTKVWAGMAAIGAASVSGPVFGKTEVTALTSALQLATKRLRAGLLNEPATPDLGGK